MRAPFLTVVLLIGLLLPGCGDSGTVGGSDIAAVEADADPDLSGPPDVDGADGAEPNPDAGDAQPSADIPEDPGPTGDEVDPPPDGTEVLFPADRAIQVEITLAPEDWDELRSQTRTIFDVLGPGCMEAPFESPFTYFPATVTVDGQTVANVGVRKKGFIGSLSTEKPSLKIKAHEYDPDLRFFGMKRLTLNNVQQDPAYVSTCLTYNLYRSAGMVAPRCALAEVTVNGELMGAFVSTDSIKKPFLAREFGDDSGTLYEGTLSDFREGWTKTFEQKTLESEGPGVHIDAVREALDASDDALLDALDAVLDLDQFMTFWALEVLVGHWDGYAGNTNNFYVYAHPEDQRLRFIPWGADATFVPNKDLKDETQDIPASVMAQGALTRRLYDHPEGRSWYLGRMQWALDSAWDEDVQQAEVDRLEGILAPLLFTHEIGGAFSRMNLVRNFINGRRAEIQAELDAGGAQWLFPMRDSFCFEFQAQVAGTVDSNFGSIQNPNPYANMGGQLTFDPHPGDWAFQGTGVQVGYSDNPDQAGRVELRLFKSLGGGLSIVAVWVFDPEHIAPGATIAVDFEQAEGYLLEVGGGEGFEFLGYLSGGEIQIEEGSTTFGTPFKATVDSLWFLF
jgi:hypothetical protein